MAEKKEEQEICPACGALIETFEDRCPNCKLEFKAAELEPDMSPESDELISLFKLNDIMEAQMIRTLLEDSGIRCMVSEGGMTSVFGAITSQGFSFSRIKVLVHKSQAKEAIKALAGHKKWNEQELNRYLSMLDEVE